jgi:hypothetical protein
MPDLEQVRHEEVVVAHLQSVGVAEPFDVAEVL